MFWSSAGREEELCFPRNKLTGLGQHRHPDPNSDRGVPRSGCGMGAGQGFLVAGSLTANALPGPTKPEAMRSWLQKSERGLWKSVSPNSSKGELYRKARVWLGKGAGGPI